MTPRSFDPDIADGEKLSRPATSPFARVRRGWWRGLATRLPVVLAVAAGGALGGCARYGIDQVFTTATAAFPWPTFLVNTLGSFCLALLLVLVLEVWPPTRYVRPFLAVGLLGSFTTFSTWMVEFDRLLAQGASTVAATYLPASLLAGIAATGLGLAVGRAVATRRTHTSTEGRR